MDYFVIKNMVRQRDKKKEALRKCRADEQRRILGHECRRMNARIMAEIEKIPDEYIRRMIVMKLLDRRSWAGVAAMIGGNTADSCRKMVTRYKWG